MLALARAIAAKPQEPKLPDDCLLARFSLRDSFKDESGANAIFHSQWTKFVGGALYLNGIYANSGPLGHGYSAVTPVPDLSYSRFAVAVHFWPIDFKRGDVVFMCGPSYRWFGVVADAKGALSISVNNGRQLFPLGITVEAHQWHHLICSVDIEKKTIMTSCDGKLMPAIRLPTDFKFDVVGSNAETINKRVGFTNYGTSGVFHGFVGDLRIYGRSLAADEMPGRQE